MFLSSCRCIASTTVLLYSLSPKAMEYPTLPQRLLDAVERHQCARAQIYKMGAQWQANSAQEMLRRVAGLSAALREIGVRAGDRVAVFAPNCPEWHIADFAVTGLGGVVVPIYFREAAERIEYIVAHSEAKVVFVAGEDQTARLAGLRARLTGVERVICAVGTQAASSDVLSYEALIASAGDAEIAAYRRRAGERRSGDLASIIYTSGTTGEPKGVMLSHANFVSNETASFENLFYEPGDVALSFLPLAHVYERTADYGFLFLGISLAYVARTEEVSQALLEVRPMFTAAVPRFYEKLYDTVMQRGAQATGVRRLLFDWSIRVARKAIPWRAYGRQPSAWTKLQWGLADRLVYKKFRAGVGGRIRLFVSGGAPLAPQLAEFFTAVGLPVSQGYGLTETSPVVTNNIVKPNHIGTVGYPLRDIEVRIADDGEVLVRGPCVMMGYYKKPEETRAAISPDGWLSTGDVGYLDKDGYLVITDRKKDLLKTAGGKLVAPAPIENALKTSPFVSNAALVGDKRRFIAALLVPNFSNIEARASAQGITFKSPAEMAGHPWVHKLIEGEIARLTANLAQYETIKRFVLLDRDFTFDGGELTYTLKLKRRVIEERYADAIGRLYAEPSPAHP
jgi:long-chain acyl-CoA synthetase